MAINQLTHSITIHMQLLDSVNTNGPVYITYISLIIIILSVAGILLQVPPTCTMYSIRVNSIVSAAKDTISQHSQRK